MLSTVRARRSALIVLTGFALLGTAACGGADLGKANFQRTTITQQAGTGGQVPQGPITDPAVATAALRTVDPCQLLDASTLGDLGTPGRPDPFGLDKCSDDVKDAGGKNIRVSLQLGDKLIGSVDEATGAVENLPQIERKDDTSGCSVTAVTSKEARLGITVQISYQGGDPCRPGRTALQKVVKRLHGKPPQYPQPAGSLIAVDLCGTVDDAVMTQILGGDAKKSGGLHDCGWSGSGPSGDLRFRAGPEPTLDDQTTKVDLGGGVSGFQKSTSPSQAQCTISWLQLPVKDKEGELISFAYNNLTVKASDDDACGKAVKAAKGVVPKLPKR